VPPSPQTGPPVRSAHRAPRWRGSITLLEEQKRSATAAGSHHERDTSLDLGSLAGLSIPRQKIWFAPPYLHLNVEETLSGSSQGSRITHDHEAPWADVIATCSGRPRPHGLHSYSA
jgi:hypothetical protein